MILKGSTGYWATGITVRWAETGNGGAWAGTLDFYDDGFAGDDNPDTGAISTEGQLRSRYLVDDGKTVTGLRAVVDALIADAAKLGITIRSYAGKPFLYYEGDGESDRFPPPEGWRGMLAVEAERIGWECSYAQKETDRG